MSEDIGKEAVLRSGGPPVETRSGFSDPDAGGKTPCPPAARAAGMIWLVLGCLIVLNGLLALALVLPAHQSSGGHEEWAQLEPVIDRATLQLVLQVLAGAFFLHAGVQTLRSAARDTLGGGIGSILFSLLGAVMAAGLASLRIFVMAEVYAPVAAMLLAAGVLALAGRSRYKTWRMAQSTLGGLAVRRGGGA